MPYTYTTATATVYKIRGRLPGDWRFWADIAIREWPGGGSIDAQSDCGLYGYSWYSIGGEPFRKFLCSLHRDYFMAKTRGAQGWKEYDGSATIREIRKTIIEDRREGEVTQKDARSMWNSLEGKGDWLFTELTESAGLRAFSHASTAMILAVSPVSAFM